MEDEGSSREVSCQAREIPWERLQHMGVMGGKSVAKANGWTDQQAIAALPAFLTSWAVEEFDTVPRKYIEKVPWEEALSFETLLEILKPKMQQYRSPRATRNEFKSVRQNENESLKEYFGRVRYLGDLALSDKKR